MAAKRTARIFERIRVIDTHTGGEPTRVVLEGGPDLGGGSFLERRRKLSEEFESCVYGLRLVREGWEQLGPTLRAG